MALTEGVEGRAHPFLEPLRQPAEEASPFGLAALGIIAVEHLPHFAQALSNAS